MSVTLQPNIKRGFTIVELLIVIVVIAILAAISIVAYNGIQNRAHNSELYSGVDAYHKAIKLYAVDEGTYPATSPAACFGGNAVLGAGSDQCSTVNTLYKINTTFDNSIKKYMGGSIPKMSLKTLTGTYNGNPVSLHTSGAYGVYTGKPAIYYYPLATNCRSGEVHITSYTFTTDAKMCVIPLPDL